MSFVGCDALRHTDNFAENRHVVNVVPYTLNRNRVLYFSVADPQLFNIISYLLSAKVKTFALQTRICQSLAGREIHPLVLLTLSIFKGLGKNTVGIYVRMQSNFHATFPTKAILILKISALRL